MRYAGSRSWSFGTSAGDQLLHATLFVRDVFGLAPASRSLVPPPLSGRPAARVWESDWADRAQAGRDWTGWYLAALATRIGSRRAALGDHLEVLNAVFDAPQFGSLADQLGLQRAAQEAWIDGCRWSSSLKPHRLGSEPPSSPIAWELIRQAAEDVAFDRGTDIGDVHGQVVVLAVDGVWWREAAPGAVVCSVAALESAETAHAVVRWAYESGLPPGPASHR
jgi:hypothetical protein